MPVALFAFLKQNPKKIVLAVLVAGSVVTWVVVPQPGGANGERIRSKWSAALGFFAAVPIAYLVLVVESQLLKPLFAGL